MEDVIGSALGSDVLGEAVWYIEPELIVVVLRIMREALDGIGRVVGVRDWYLSQDPRPNEPQLTRRLRRAMVMVRKDHHDIQCEFHHQDEQAREVPGDRPDGYRRFDITVKFAGQPMDEDQYLSLECKFLSVGDRESHRSYVRDGVQRYVDGTYAHRHDWACMVGFERNGPLETTVDFVRSVMREVYSDDCRLDIFNGSAELLASRHRQISSGQEIQILHTFISLHN